MFIQRLFGLNFSKMKVTIITPAYNSEKYIQSNIDSVNNQKYEFIEHIIKDGVSKDGTLEIVNRISKKNQILLSNRDESMYDAINQALKIASGDLIWVLNSDDYIIAPTTIQKVVEKIRKESDWFMKCYLGDLVCSYPESGTQSIRRAIVPSVSELVSFGNCTFVPQPCLIIPARLARRVGYFNLKFKYASDYEYIIRLLSISKIVPLRFSTTVFRKHPEAITSRHNLEMQRETLEISRVMLRNKNLGLIKKYFHSLNSSIRYTTKNPVVFINLIRRWLK